MGRASATLRASVSRSWLAVSFRCLLIVASWQGPLPWCHCHTTNETGSSWEAHLAQYHSSLTVHWEEELGWHLHIEIPLTGDDRDGNGEPDDGEWNGVPAVVSRGLSLLTAGMDAVPDERSAVSRQCLMRCLAAICAADRGPTSFYALFAPSLPLPMRFGVCRP